MDLFTPYPSFMQSLNRRLDRRVPVEVFVNQYVDGVPTMCNTLDISWSGMLVKHLREPPDLAMFAIEFGLPEREGALWAFARPVWQMGKLQALRIVGMDSDDNRVFARFLSEHRAA